MALTLYHSHRIEDLVERLSLRLAQMPPTDPFQRIPVCVGSRGMARWLEHELATRLGVAAGLDFPFPRAALGGAVRWVLELGGEPGATFWDPAFWAAREGASDAPAGEDGLRPLRDEDWQPDALAFRVLPLLRRWAGPRPEGGADAGGAAGEGADEATGWFDAPRRFLASEGPLAAGRGGAASPVSRRELTFARAVADVLDTLSHEAPLLGLEWARSPARAYIRGGAREVAGIRLKPQDARWLGKLAQEVGLHEDPSSPAARFERLKRLEPVPGAPRPWLGLFGLSTLGPGDRGLLEILGRHLDVDLFLLAPSPHYWEDMVRRVRVTDADADARALHDNPVLASLGRASAQIIGWVADRGVDAHQLDEAGWRGGWRDEAPVDEPETLLQHVQRWVYQADGVGQPGAQGEIERPESLASLPAAAAQLVRDGSLRLHSAHSALRQCEVLRDELLQRFADDSTLDPREVLVMTPQVDVFAPLLAAVFARRGLAVSAQALVQGSGETPAGGSGEAGAETTRLPRLEAAISDLGLRQTNPVAEVLLAALELAGERVTAPRIAALLGLDPVRRRLGLDEDDVGAIVQGLVESHTRWGLDAADRARSHAQPLRDPNTVRFGAERVALGALMPDPQGLTTLRPPAAGAAHDLALLGLAGQGEGAEGLDLAEHALVRGVVPLAVAGAEGREGELRAGALALVARRLAWVRALLAGPHPMVGWVARLRAVMGGLAETTEAATWLKLQVDEELGRLEAAGAGQEGPALSREAVQAWLQGRFDNPVTGGGRPVTGAIAVSGLEPMRAVPFRVVALLGMDDGVFPRDPVHPAWDPLHGAPGGPVARRDVDRHLLLEALLSAREALWIFWTGRDANTNEPKPAAVPIEELAETLGRLLGRDRRALVTEHPLQPWSPLAFLAGQGQPEGGAGATGGPRGARPFELGWARAAEHLWAEARGKAAPRARGLGDAGLGPAGEGPEPLAPERTPPTEVGLMELASALYRGGRAFLRRRLKLPWEEDGSWPSPFDPGSFPEAGERPNEWIGKALDEMLSEPELLRDAAQARAHLRRWEAAQGGEGAEGAGEAEAPEEVLQAQGSWEQWLSRYAKRLYGRLEAEGRTPPPSIGVGAVRKIVGAAAELALRLAELLGGLSTEPSTGKNTLSDEPLPLSVSVPEPDEEAFGPGSVRVVGEWPLVLRVPEPEGPDGAAGGDQKTGLAPGRWLLVASSFGPTDWAQLHAWLGLLAGVASGHEDLRGVLLLDPAGKKDVEIPAPEAPKALALLADLVAVWREARRRPLPLFKNTSPEVAGLLAKGLAPAEGGGLPALDAKALGNLVGKTYDNWFGTPGSSGDVSEPENQLLFGSYNPADEVKARGLDAPVVRWAVRVWGPLLRMDEGLWRALCGEAEEGAAAIASASGQGGQSAGASSVERDEEGEA